MDPRNVNEATLEEAIQISRDLEEGYQTVANPPPTRPRLWDNFVDIELDDDSSSEDIEGHEYRIMYPQPVTRSGKAAGCCFIGCTLTLALLLIAFLVIFVLAMVEAVKEGNAKKIPH
ncbi:hypothetical protein FPOA_03507 [Fusarium poae]|uniref:Uncharacterized protein n=1 Tax=Fusarium poae TaxID=36050 RepID=A0A1B8BA13_FUSPO|nr:hypothetical protein FPOA_03507 [Fusarium poae]